jgi:hypothetical protein
MVLNVVVFMPPPVEAGEAPVYMSKMVTNLDASVRSPSEIVLNPAVLGVID